MEKSTRKLTKRKSIRFEPDLGTFAFVDFALEAKAFKPTVSGLTIDESYRGCSFVTKSDSNLKAGKEIRIKTGNLAVLSGQIRWVKKLTPKIMHIGVEYLE